MKAMLSGVIVLVAVSTAALAACPPPETVGISGHDITKIGLASLEAQGMSEPPNSDPPWSYADWRQAIRSKIRWQLESIGVPNADRVLFAFERRQPVPAPLRGPGAEPEGPIFIPVRPETLWCLVAPGDIVVFLRGISHMSTVFGVDRSNEVIYFADPWPESFLLPEFDLVRVSAVTDAPAYAAYSEKLLVKLSRKAFERRVHSLYKIGTRHLPEAVMDLEPDARDDPYLHLAFGLTLLQGNTFSNWYDLRYADIAASSLSAALSAAPPGDLELRRFAAEKLYLAVRLSTALARAVPPQAAALSEFNEAALETAFDRDAHIRLGVAHGIAKEYKTAIKHFDRSLEIEPDWSVALTARAIARWELRERRGAVADAEEALARLAHEAARLSEQRASRLPSNWIGAHLDRDTERRLVILRGMLLDRVLLAQKSSEARRKVLDLTAGLVNIDDPTAVAIPLRMLEVEPDKQLRADAARELGKSGQVGLAVPALQAAVACDPDWIVRQFGLVALINLGDAAAAAVPQVMAVLMHPNYDVRYTAELFLGNHNATEETEAVKAAVGDGERKFEDVIAELVAQVGTAAGAERSATARALVLTARGTCAPSFAPRARSMPWFVRNVYKDAETNLTAQASDQARQAAAELAQIISEWPR